MKTVISIRRTYLVVLAALCVLGAAIIVLRVGADPIVYEGEVTLQWDPSPGTVGGYRIHYGTSSGQYQTTVDVGNQTSYVIEDLVSGQNYYFAVSAYDSGGQNESGYSNEVAVFTPLAGFTASATSGSAPLSVTFTDTSLGTITSWDWDFGDGSTGELRHPVHVYTHPGAYSVYLTVTGPGGVQTKAAAGLITVTSGGASNGPVASFTANNTSGIAPFAVAFADSSSGGGISWTWDFGDGELSTIQNPVHTYEFSGTYSVSLTIAGASGEDTVTMSHLISVSTPAGPDPTVCSWVDVDPTHSEACVSHSSALQDCLDEAASDGRHNTLMLQRGVYTGSFSYVAEAGENADLTMIGGYTSGCAESAADPDLTVLDGGLNGVVLSLDAASSHASGGLWIEGFRIRNGINGAQGGDGGCLQAYTFSGGIQLAGNVVDHCVADQGGGLSVESASGSIVILNNVLFENSATEGEGGGGLLQTVSGTITALNNTVSENRSRSGGGGLAIALNGDSGSVDVTNNIIWNNSLTPGDPEACGSDILLDSDGDRNGHHGPVGFSRNLLDLSAGWCSTDSAYGIPSGNLSANPQFVDASSDNFHIVVNSPCVNAGDNDHPLLPEAERTDVDGDDRLVFAPVDIGADEAILPLPAATGMLLSANPSGPVVVGTPITYIVTGAGGTGNYQYRFMYRPKKSPVWTLAQAYSSRNSWTWATAPEAIGAYAISVEVRTLGSEAEKDVSRSLTANLQKPKLVVTASPARSAAVGSGVTFNSDVSNGGGAGFEYRYLLKPSASPDWSVARAYSSAKTWAWDTTSVAAGSYGVMVQVRAAGSSQEFQAAKTVRYKVALPKVALTASASGKQSLGTPVTYTASVLNGTGNYEYRFLRRTSASSDWTVVRDFSEDASWTWNTASSPVGAHAIEVRVRPAGTSVESLGAKSLALTLAQP